MMFYNVATKLCHCYLLFCGHILNSPEKSNNISKGVKDSKQNESIVQEEQC